MPENGPNRALVAMDLGLVELNDEAGRLRVEDEG
jgi:hypothetical protein